jgi:hypothetical protein
MKFVPASGAASRMFRLLLSLNNRSNTMDAGEIEAQARANSDYQELFQFVSHIKTFAFYEELKPVLARRGKDIDRDIKEGQFKAIVEAVLSEDGLNYLNQAKALIPFHRYPDHTRTALEEHLAEACHYVNNGFVPIHFTVSPEHERSIRQHAEEVRSRYEKSGFRFDLSFSIQKVSAQTLAVDLHNQPFRDAEGKLVFRPAGHGALLANMNDLNGDIVFIKNIDNVVPDAYKTPTFRYKKVLGGVLIEIQSTIFNFLNQLENETVSKEQLEEIVSFAKNTLFMECPYRLDQKEELRRFLLEELNRPLRVCGMVKSQGEPGGGPFWVRSKNGRLSKQIVEQSQMDMSSAEQKRIWNSSTHFNPVDLVCGLKDHHGRPHNLMNYCDPETGSIVVKSKDGHPLKTLELPGLWNGGMAHWITVFVEVPISTFNPVKVINDLLRKEHQS